MYEDREENNQEHARMIIALQMEGWSAEKILEFVRFVAGGDQERYEAFLKKS